MKVYAYGEDALTLWAIKNRLPEILKQLNGGKDVAEEVVKKCKIFFRPSFGRGKNYGEFDFIILANDSLYLGESKWDESSIKFEDKGKKKLNLDEPQKLRHKIFCWYVDKMNDLVSRNKNIIIENVDWGKFKRENNSKFEELHNGKSIPSQDKKLAKNIMKVIGLIFKNCNKEKLIISNVFLYLYNSQDLKDFPNKSSTKTFEILNRIKKQQQDSCKFEVEEFQIVTIDYSRDLKDNLIEIEV